MMEPIVEKRFEYKGYPCVILFMPWSCHRCGYVGVPASKGKMVWANLIDCHGGVTYVEDHLYGQEDQDILWIGFDCMHAWDARDIETGKRLAAADPKLLEHIKRLEDVDRRYDTGGIIRALEYCMNECKRIADQIEDQMKRCKNCGFYNHDLYKITSCGRTRGSLQKLCGLHNDWRTDGEFCSSWKEISNQQPAAKATDGRDGER